jgi:DNA invertase Pin-like site-specific DNA recombinase
MSDRKRQLRCAIYTRKSSDEGLEQDFNSLDAQREACEAYVRSQRAEGWTALPDRYDDGGWSGGTLERPALQALLADIEAGNVDIVVVYKIDRLTRSLMDFSKLVEVLDRNEVTFVSVTQAFNTTTSMGRLTLNILLSFAQFEREVTGERIRDKIAASKKKGMWMGGMVPIGYEAKDRTLAIVESEAEVVRTIFRLYLELGNVTLVEEELRHRGITTRRMVAASGRVMGGKPFSRGHIYRVLGNPLYIGRICHKTETYDGQHPAIIDRATWDAVKAQLAANTRGKRSRPNVKEPSLISGLLFDENGNRMVADHAVKSGRRYRYYVARSEDGAENGGAFRISASEIEPVVAGQVIGFLRSTGRLFDELGAGQLSPDRLQVVIAAAANLATNLESGSGPEQRELLADLIERVVVGASSIEIHLKRAALTARLVGDGVASVDRDDPIVVEAPVRIARRGVETKLVIEGDGAAAAGPDPALIKAVARGHVWFDDLVTGRATSIAEIAEREGMTGRYVARLLDLAFLPPALVEDIVAGRQPVEMTAETLSRSERPLLWAST